VKQNATHETNTDETIVSAHSNDEAGMIADQEHALQARYEQRKQTRFFARHRRNMYLRQFLRMAVIAVIVVVLWLVGVGIVKGYGMLKNEAGKEVAMRRFEQALKEKDIAVLKSYIQMPDETMSIDKTTFAPLFAYLDAYPQAYKKLHRDLEKQWNNKHVYIKGLTSQPPIFSMKVYEKQFFLFNQYMFEPTLYSLVVHVEGENVTILVNGKKVQGEETKEPFSQKLGPYLPGMYNVTVIRKEGEETVKKTKTVVLFGGKRVHEVDF
jgi:uncharacterized membrane protein YvbJ